MSGNIPASSTGLVPILFVGCRRSGTSYPETAAENGCYAESADGDGNGAPVQFKPGQVIGNHAAPSHGNSVTH
jgi:hypothetical protein